MTPVEGTALALLLPTAGAGALVVAQEASGAGLWAILTALVGVVIATATWLMRRDDARQKREDEKADAREAAAAASTKSRDDQLVAQTGHLSEIVVLQRRLLEQQTKSDENRFHATKVINDKLDAVPERTEHRLRDLLK